MQQHSVVVINAVAHGVNDINLEPYEDTMLVYNHANTIVARFR